MPRRHAVVTCVVWKSGIRNSYVIIGGYAQAQVALSQSSLIDPLLPRSIFPSPNQVTNSPSCIKPPLIIHLSTIFIIIQAINTTLFSPSGSKVADATDSDSGPLGSFFAFFSDQTDAFSIQALPLLSTTVLGSAAPFPHSLRVCNFWLDLQNGFVLLYCLLPPFPYSPSPHFMRPLIPSWSRIYESSDIHLTCYMIHVQASLSSSPLPILP